MCDTMATESGSEETKGFGELEHVLRSQTPRIGVERTQSDDVNVLDEDIVLNHVSSAPVGHDCVDASRQEALELDYSSGDEDADSVSGLAYTFPRELGDNAKLGTVDVPSSRTDSTPENSGDAEDDERNDETAGCCDGLPPKIPGRVCQREDISSSPSLASVEESDDSGQDIDAPDDENVSPEEEGPAGSDGLHETNDSMEKMRSKGRDVASFGLDIQALGNVITRQVQELEEDMKRNEEELVTTYREEVASRDAVIDSLDLDVAELRKDLDRREHELVLADRTNRVLSAENVRLKDSDGASIASLHRENDGLRIENDKYRQEIYHLKLELERSKSTMSPTSSFVSTSTLSTAANPLPPQPLAVQNDVAVPPLPAPPAVAPAKSAVSSDSTGSDTTEGTSSSGSRAYNGRRTKKKAEPSTQSMISTVTRRDDVGAVGDAGSRNVRSPVVHPSSTLTTTNGGASMDVVGDRSTSSDDSRLPASKPPYMAPLKRDSRESRRTIEKHNAEPTAKEPEAPTDGSATGRGRKTRRNTSTRSNRGDSLRKKSSPTSEEGKEKVVKKRWMI